MAYRVLHCLASMNRGGAETFIMNVFRGIDRCFFNFDFLLNSDDGAYIEEINSLGGKVYVIPSRSAGIRNYCKALDAFFGKHKNEFDALHFHTSSLSSLEVLYFAKKNGIKKRIIHSHSTRQNGLIHNVLHWINKPLIKYLATDYLACSRVAADWLYKYTGVHSKSIVVNNGIDVEKFAFNEHFRKEIRSSLKINEHAVVLGHVGRFDEVKNHTFLLKIFKSFLKIQPDSYLILIGIGPLKSICEQEAKQLGVVSNVKFVGLQTEIYKFLSAFDYFIFPSLYEGLPVALVEAQTSGLTTICSDKVSQEARISSGLTFFPLEKNADEWAKYIAERTLVDRVDSCSQVIANGYSIQHTISFLTTQVYR